jgi:hypothetical protein
MGKNRTYFIKDESLKNIDHDFFRHQDLAENMRSMIDNTDAPFNVAIIGKWGLGKSSLINMVTQPMKKDPQHYIVQEINAWKYEKDELCRTFLKKLYQGISGEKKELTFEKIKKDAGTLFAEEYPETAKRGKKPVDYIGLAKIACSAGVILLISFIVFVVYSLLSIYYLNQFQDFNLINFALGTFINYCRKIGTLFFIPLLLWVGKKYMDAFVEKSQKKIEITYPLETRDDYEIYLENKIERLLAEKPGIKIITVIDDLDRLSAEKMVEALDALKTFMDFKQCIFIVPFDDNILKKAIEQKKLDELNRGSEEVVESELILDKLFQYKIYLPELIKTDIKDYACDICRKYCGDFIKDYVGEAQMERIIRNVLIHSNVKTPRQVIKIINVFINNVMVARKREDAHKVHKGFSTSEEELRMIAKLSVLQADFNDFYDFLFVDAEAMDKLLDIHNNECSEIEEHLKKFCYKIDGVYYIKKEYMPLVNYLSFTVKCKVPSILPYLYMAQDEISVLTGDQKQQDFLAAVESQNEKTVKRMISETPELALSLKNMIEFTDDAEQVLRTMVMAINTIGDISDLYVEDIANAVAGRSEEVTRAVTDISCENLNFENLFALRSKAEEKSALRSFLKRCIKETDEPVCGEMFKVFLKNENSLEESLQYALADQIKDYAKQEIRSVEEIISLLDGLDDDLIIRYMGIEYFEELSKCIMAESEFDEQSLDWLRRLYNLFIDKTNINSYSDLWISMAKYPLLHQFIMTLFDEEKISWLDMSCSDQIVVEIRNIPFDKYQEYTYEMLARYSFEVDENNSVEIDALYAKILETHYFATVAEAFGKQHSFEHLSSTIKALISKSFDDAAYGDDVRQLYCYFTSAQKQALMKELLSHLAFSSSKTYEPEKLLVDILVKSKEAIEEGCAEQICAEILRQLPSNGNKSNFFELAVFVIEECCRDIAGKTYIDFMNKLLPSYAQFPVELMKCLRNVNEAAPNAYRVTLMKKIMAYEDDRILDDVSALVIENSHIFNKENGNISDPIDFYIRHYTKLTNTRGVVDFLNKKYPTITATHMEALGELVMNDKENLEYASEKLRRLYDNLQEADYVRAWIHYIKEDHPTERIKKLLLGENSSFDNVIGIVVKDASAWSPAELDMLVRASIDLSSEINWTNCYLLLNAYTDKNQDFTQNERALALVKAGCDKLDKKQKKQCLQVMHTIYMNTGSDSLKKEVIKTVRSIRGTAHFKSLLGKEEMDEFAHLMEL